MCLFRLDILLKYLCTSSVVDTILDTRIINEQCKQKSLHLWSLHGIYILFLCVYVCMCLDNGPFCRIHSIINGFKVLGTRSPKRVGVKNLPIVCLQGAKAGVPRHQQLYQGRGHHELHDEWCWASGRWGHPAGPVLQQTRKSRQPCVYRYPGASHTPCLRVQGLSPSTPVTSDPGPDIDKGWTAKNICVCVF